MFILLYIHSQAHVVPEALSELMGEQDNLSEQHQQTVWREFSELMTLQYGFWKYSDVLCLLVVPYLLLAPLAACYNGADAVRNASNQDRVVQETRSRWRKHFADHWNAERYKKTPSSEDDKTSSKKSRSSHKSARNVAMFAVCEARRTSCNPSSTILVVI